MGGALWVFLNSFSFPPAPATAGRFFVVRIVIGLDVFRIPDIPEASSRAGTYLTRLREGVTVTIHDGEVDMVRMRRKYGFHAWLSRRCKRNPHRQVDDEQRFWNRQGFQILKKP